MKKIYLSSGFFTEETKAKVEEVAKVLREWGCEVFVPMEHTISNAWDIGEIEWAKKVFEQDIKAIDECDILVYLNFGAEGDCGAAWEAGYAYAKNIPYYVYNYADDMSLMVWGGCQYVEDFSDDSYKLI